MQTSPTHRFSLAPAFLILVGLSMISMWSMFLLTGQVPELRTKPWSISMHLAAEFGTAILLLAAGLMILRGSSRAKPVTLFALGMLIYTVIQSSGYYLDLAQPVFVGMFAVLGVIAAGLTVRLLTR